MLTLKFSHKTNPRLLKKAFWTIFFLCILNINLGLAQEEQKPDKEKTHYGIKAGVNFAELFGDDAIPESDRKVGYSFGAYASFKLTKSFKLQPEVIWSLQGEKSEKKGRYDISYINIPLMCKWTEGRIYTELGPQMGLLTINTSKSVPDSIRLENFESFDFSVNVGFGYEVFEDWIVGFRYCQGLTNIVSGRDLKNSVIYLGISYRVF